MKRFPMAISVAAVLCGAVLVGQPVAKEKPDGPPLRQGPGGAGGQRAPGGIHLIPRFAEAKLNLTDDQKKQIADLEKDVKDKLGKILSAEQMQMLEERGPGAGGPGGGGQAPPPPPAPQN